MAPRFTTVIIVLCSAYAFLLFHLYQLQLVKGSFYLAKADAQITNGVIPNSKRGAIYFTDKNNNTLAVAVNQDFPVIYAVPTAIKDPAAAAHVLGSILGMNEISLRNIFTSGSSYRLLINKAKDDVAQAVADANIKGVYADYQSERYYPLHSIGAQVLGFVGPDASGNAESGHYGIEAYYNDQLADGDVTLTIDPNIQTEAEKILSSLVVANGATGGDVVVEDPKTGKILAMGGYPTFDPNEYQSSSLATFLNTNVQSQYEPGSIIKVLTMAAGLDSGAVMPNTTYPDKGYLKIGTAKITNYDSATHGAYGPGTTMTEIIEHSINTGAIFVENQTGNSTFYAYMQKFGLNKKTGIGLPGEIAGSMAQLTPRAPQINWDTAAYGQGVAVTPIELISAVGAIANDGVMMRPYLDASMKPEVVGRVISSKTAGEVTGMMVSAVDKAKVANIDGYSLAGKTGSAFMPDLVRGGYLNLLTDSYIGFGPTTHPQFIALIRLNSLPLTALAAESVVPAFKQLSQFIINYYNIPPDRLAPVN